MKFAKKTIELIEKYKSLGYEIHVGNNPRMGKTEKWKNHDLIRIAQTNDRRSGLCKRTIWASKEKQWKIAFLGWENPNNQDLTGYHPDYYAQHFGVDYPGIYNTQDEAQISADLMAQPDPFGVYPELIVEIVKESE